MNNLRPIRARRSTIRLATSLSLMSLLWAPTTALAADLLNVYSLAIKNEPEWSAQRAKYLSNREAEKIGLAGILPQISLNARHAKVNYDVDGNNSSTLNNANLLNLSVTDTFNCSVDNGIFSGDLTTEEIDGFSECATSAQGSVETSFTVTDTAFNVTQPLFRLDRWYGYKQSQAVTDQAEIEYQLAQQELILRVADTYFNTLKAWEQVEFTRNEESAIRKQLRATQKRFQKGLIGSTNVYEAQAIFDLAQSTRFSAENFFRGAVEDLEQMTRQPGIEITPLPTHLPITSPEPDDSEAWVIAARKNNLDLQAAKFAAQAAKHNHRVKKSNHAPTIDFLASFSQSSADGRTSTLDQGDTQSSSIGITLNVPIFSGGGISANERQAKFQMREAEYRVEQISQEVIGNTRKAFRSVVTSVHQIEALNVAIISNQKALEAVEKGYKVGTRNVSEVLQAQRELFSAYKDHSNARYDYILNTLRLKRAAGVLNKEDLSNLNAWLSKGSTSTAPLGSSSNVNEPRDTFEPHASKHDTRAQKAQRPQFKDEHLDNEPDSEKPETFIEVMKGWF